MPNSITWILSVEAYNQYVYVTFMSTNGGEPTYWSEFCANDPRVPASEADQIIAAVRAQGGQAWHLLGQNEGHGFAKKENADYQFWASLMFWKQTLLAE